MAQLNQFDAKEATVTSVHDALFSGRTTCRQIVSAFIARIEAFNPIINAIISLNPDALKDADTLDGFLTAGRAKGSLFGIPILLKDNFDAVGMKTTGGSIALKDCEPKSDATTVKAFRDAGAIILGKTNLHELALEGLSVSSLGGQTLNPYDLTRTPGGSSGGTGAAIAASFAVFGTGTDTMNSLRSPASANSLYSFRPTAGLISRAGVIPVSNTQDTVGVIGRCLEDLAISLTVMAGIGYDERDQKTAFIPDTIKGMDYSEVLSVPTPANGCRIGVLTSFFDRTPSTENLPVNRLMDETIRIMASSGADIVNIDDTTTYDFAKIATLDVQRFEFREMLNSYLSSDLTREHPNSMEELYCTNQEKSNFLVIPAQYTHIHNSLQNSTSDARYIKTLQRITELKAKLKATFDDLKLDAIIYPEQRNLVVPVGSPSQSGRNGILAAVTGCPVTTIPIGFSEQTESAPIGLPVGMEILGLHWSEHDLFRIAKSIDDQLHARRPPAMKDLDFTHAPGSWYAKVPFVTPGGLHNVDNQAYPAGTIGRAPGHEL